MSMRAVEMIAELAGLGTRPVNDAHDLSDDLGLDTLDRIELAIRLEEELRIELPIEDWRTVGDVVRDVDEALRRRAAA